MASFVLIYLLIYATNFIVWVSRFDYYSYEDYLPIALVFSAMVAFEFWTAAGIFGTAVIVGDIIQYNIIRSQGSYVTMAGGFAFMGIMLAGLIVGLICQFIVSKYLKHNKK